MKRLLLYMVLLLSAAAFSQQPADTIVLKEIEIREAYPSLPGIVRISISEAVLQENRLKNISDVIVTLPSLHVRSAGPGTSSLAYVRGAGASHTSLSWNGMLLNSPMTGQADLSLVPALFTDDIMLLAGNNSAFGHISSIGGTICLDNSAPWEKPEQFSMMFSGGSFGNYSGGFFVSNGNKNIISRFRIYGKSEDNRYPYHNTAILPKENMIREDAGIQQGALQHELFYRNKKMMLSLITWSGITDRSIPALMTNVTAAGHDEKQKDRFFRTTGSAEWNRRRLSYFIKPSFSASDLSYHLIHYTPGGSITSLDSYSKELSAASHQGLRYHFKKSVVRTGIHASFCQAELSEKKYRTGYTHNRAELSHYLNFDQPIGRNFRILAASRSGWSGKEPIPFMPSLHLYYRPQNHKLPVFYVSAGKNIRFPSLNDLYFIPGGNPMLKRETSLSYETGMEDCLFRIAGNCLHVTLTLFYQDIDGWIIWQPSPFGYWQPFNIRSATSKGFSCHAGWIREFKNGRAEFSAQYTFNQASANDDQYETGQPVYLPLHNLHAFSSLTYRKWKTTLSGFYMSERKTSLYLNTWSPVLAPVWIQNLSIGRTFTIKKRSIETSLQCENLFNHTWQQILWRPMPGRSFVFNVRFELW